MKVETLNNYGTINSISDSQVVITPNGVQIEKCNTANQTAPVKKENRKAKKSDAKPAEKQHGVEYPVFSKGLGVTDNHLKFVYRLLTSRGWISTQTSETEFLRLFCGKSNDCEIQWTGQTRRGNNEPSKLGKPALYVLFQKLVDERLITTNNKEKIGPILETHFIDKEGRFLTDISNVNSTSSQANEVIEKVISIMRVSPTSEKLESFLAEEMQEKYEKHGNF